MTHFLLRLFVKNADQTSDPKVRAAVGTLSGIVGILCNFFLFLGKVIIGTLSGSVSITADAMNNLSDAASSIVTLVGFKLAEQPADAEHPYGHARFEYLSGLVVSAMIVIIGFELAKTSVGKILSPVPVVFSAPLAAVLVLSIAAAVCIGQSRKAGYIAKQPVTLPEVKYHQWICDEAGLLSEKTKEEIQQYNSDWDSRYYAAVAVATVDSITGWTPEKAAEKLGADWGLGENDMLLLLVRNGDYYVNCGGKVRAAMTDTQQMKLKQAIETPYYNGDFDGAALAFYRQADVFYGQTPLGGSKR